MCKKEFSKNEKKNYKVRDHCHYTGKYRGAAHNICNLRYKVPKKILILFHNGSIYNYHFIIKELVKEFVDNLSEGIHNNKCSDCGSNLNYIKTTAKPSSFERKNEKLISECYNCKQRYKKKINKELIKRFTSTYSFCNNDLNKFILLLRKGVYPYEYMGNWERFNETSLPSKELFYSNLNMENIDDIDYRQGNNVFNKFKLNNLGDFHDLYVQSDTL